MSKKAGGKRHRKGEAQRKRKGRPKPRPRRKLRKVRQVTNRSRRPARTRPKPKRGSRRAKPDPRLKIAVREMNRGRSLSSAARALGFSSKTLQLHLRRKRLLTRKGNRWVVNDKQLRRIPTMTGGRSRVIIVRGYAPARLVGEHHNAVGEFVRTNDITVLMPFKGRSVRSASGREFILETDPNVLHRIAAMDSPQFHEIYKITSTT